MLDEREAEFVRAARVARIATVDQHGWPHGSPICPLLDGTDIVFATWSTSKKHRNLEAEPRASIVFDEYDDDWQDLRFVIVFGRATLFEDGDEFRHARALLYDRFPLNQTEAPIEVDEQVVVRVAIERVASMGFD